MTVLIDRLRKLLDESGGGPAEIPTDALGFGDGLRVLFPDGVLLFAGGTESGSGTGRVPFADTSAAARLTIDVAVANAVLAVDLPSPGASAELLARCAGFELPALPCEPVERLILRLDAREGSTIAGTGARTTLLIRENGERLFVAVTEGWQVLCTDTPLPLARLAGLEVLGHHGIRRKLLPDPDTGELQPGAWLLLPELSPRQVLVPLATPRRESPPDPLRVDGLGRALPATTPRTRRTGPVFRPTRAVAGTDGFAILAGTRAESERGNGRFDLTISSDGAVADLEYDYRPLLISGALGLLPAAPPYQTIIGGVLMFSFISGPRTSLYGTAMGAYVVPSGQAKPSFFGYAGIGGDPGIGIPSLRVTGLSAGFGWNSRIRVPEIEDFGDFPFLKALTNPAAIGAEKGDPVEVLRTLTTDADAWVTPVDDELWVAGGFSFTLAELVTGRALAVVQTGAELTIAMLGGVDVELPKGARRKYARIASDLRAVLKPNQGELAFNSLLSGDSFVIDPNCRVRGGAAFRAWFGASQHSGDFVYTVGGYHPNYRAPQRYPIVPRIGFDWDLTGKVTISGDAYLAITPAAAMTGGSLDIRFHSGIVRAWCTARMNALIQWTPFYFDVELRVSIGVSASVRVIFVRITITVEVGVGLGIWGPPTGGEAEIKLWFISFTIRFGRDREVSNNELDWPGFSAMLPPASNNVRVLPGAGLLVEQHPDVPTDDYWEVSASGFTFRTDTTVPITQVYLGSGTAAVESGNTVNLRPTRWRGVSCTQRVSLTLDGAPHDLGTWVRGRRTAAVSAELWGSGSSGTLPSGDGHLVPNQLLGVEFTSPASSYGTSTGFIDEKAIAFDPIAPEGIQPLDPAAPPAGAIPQRPDDIDVIDRIATTIAAPAQRDARNTLTRQLTALGFDLGSLDDDLSEYSRVCRTAFTAAPMIVPAS